MTLSQAAVPWQPAISPDQDGIATQPGSVEACSSDHQEDNTIALNEGADASKQLIEVSLQKEQMIQEPNAAWPDVPQSDERQVTSSLDAGKQAEQSRASKLLGEVPQRNKELCNPPSWKPEPQEQPGMHTSPSATTASNLQFPANEDRVFSEQQKKDAGLSSDNPHQDTAYHVDKPSADSNARKEASKPAVSPYSPASNVVGQDGVTTDLSSAAATPQQPSLSTAAHKDGQASVMDVLMDAQKLTTTPANDLLVSFAPVESGLKTVT